MRLDRLEDALEQLDAIHHQVLRSELFRGYRPAPMLATGILALVAATVQAVVPATRSDPTAYATWWLVVAAVAGVVCALDLWRAVAQHHADAIRKRTVPVVAQFVPALAAGVAVTLCFYGSASASFLPGIWAMLFALGVFASRPFLPHTVGWVAAFYLAAGASVLLLDGRPGAIPSPWSMGLTFGCGQVALAAVLHRGIPRVSVALGRDPGPAAPVASWEGGADGNPA
jgi:hypothetical protein